MCLWMPRVYGYSPGRPMSRSKSTAGEVLGPVGRLDGEAGVRFSLSSSPPALEKPATAGQLGPALLRRRVATSASSTTSACSKTARQRGSAWRRRVLRSPRRAAPGCAPGAPRCQSVVPGARAEQLARVDPGRVAARPLPAAPRSALDRARVAAAVGERVAQHHVDREAAAARRGSGRGGPPRTRPTPLASPVAGERPHPRVEEHEAARRSPGRSMRVAPGRWARRSRGRRA